MKGTRGKVRRQDKYGNHFLTCEDRSPKKPCPGACGGDELWAQHYKCATCSGTGRVSARRRLISALTAKDQETLFNKLTSDRKSTTLRLSTGIYKFTWRANGNFSQMDDDGVQIVINSLDKLESTAVGSYTKVRIESQYGYRFSEPAIVLIEKKAM